MYKNYEVGQRIDDFKNHAEGAQFDINNGLAQMRVFFHNPTEREIEQFKSDKNFEIRFIELYGIIMMTAKIGNLNWMDAPYTPHLSPNLGELPSPSEGEGIGLLLMLIDAATGEIKHLRLLGLSTKFSRKLLDTIQEEAKKNFDKTVYNVNLTKLYSAYSTKQIANMSSDYCKIHAN